MAGFRLTIWFGLGVEAGVVKYINSNSVIVAFVIVYCIIVIAALTLKEREGE